VSGSYDESILIWHKDRDGKWIQAHTLKQQDAIANAERANLSEVARTTVAAQAQQLQAAQVLMTLPGNQAGGQNPNGQNGPANPHAHGQAMNPAVANVPTPVLAPAPPPVHHHHHHVHPRRPLPIDRTAARVFKLQFDARKIICASVDPRIVGWDFANGDEEIAEACPFFQGL
jgi:F-box and WD-40 domain protein 1/11